MRNYSDRKLQDEQFDTSGRKSGGVSAQMVFVAGHSPRGKQGAHYDNKQTIATNREI